MARVVALAALLPVATLLNTPAAFASISTPSALNIAGAMKADGTVITGASFVTVPPRGTPNGVSDAPLAGLPTDGSTFAVLTTGDVHSATNAPPDTANGTTTELGGGNVRGNSDFDVSILKVDFTVGARMNCVRFDFQFLTEEYPEFRNQDFNDAFIAELDTSDWTTSGSTITAPHNFAFDPNNQPISVDAAGNTSMTAGPNDTTYDGATPVLSASHVVGIGAHSLYLSILDQRDQRVDSAVFLDNLVVGYAPNPNTQCAPGAAPKDSDVTLVPPTASKAVGGSHTVNATVTDLDGAPINNAKLLFTVTGANSTTGTGTTDASGKASFTYTGTAVGDDTITACHDSNGNGTCDSGEAIASVNATWTAATSTPTTPPATPTHTATPAPGFAGLPVTGSPVGLIAGVGAAAVVIGVVGFILIRRRRVRFVAE